MEWRRFFYDEVDSTNDLAFDALARGEGRHGDVFIATSQREGRGTRGRRWTSEPGGLYLSVILESPSMPPPGLWTVAGALACHDVATAFGVDAALDWPNDLVSTSEAKIAGVLAESKGLGGRSPTIFVAGIGMNVCREVLPEALDRARPVVSLAQLAGNVTLETATARLLDSLQARVEQALERPGTLYGEFYGHCLLSGQEVVVDVAGQQVEGRFEGLGADGTVRLIDPATGSAKSVSIAHVRRLSGKNFAPVEGSPE